MALSRKEARDRVCIAIASQLHDVSLFDLIEKRLNGEDISYEGDLGIEEEGRGVFVRPLNVVFKHVPTGTMINRYGGELRK